MLLLGAPVAPASASAPCWKKLITDLYRDGRIDKTYPQPCYQDAIKHLPTDVKVYSNLATTIRRAQTAAIQGKAPGAGPSGGQTGGAAPGPGSGKPPGPKGGVAAATTTSDKGGSGPIGKALDALGAPNPDSVPIPLLILAGLALLLLAAGAAGLVARRMQTRRARP